MKGRAVVVRELGRLYQGEGLSRLRSVALQVTRRDPVESEELVQEACRRALQKANYYDPSRPLGAWLAVILVNAYRDKKKALSNRCLSLEGSMSPDGAALVDALPEGSAAGLDDMIGEERRRMVRGGLGELPNRLRGVVKLHLAGLTYERIAERTGVSVGTVRSRASRAYSKLRRLLKDAE